MNRIIPFRYASLLLAVALATLLPTVVAGQEELPQLLTVSQVQGLSHTSPFLRERVRVEGVVSALAPGRGFYMESLIDDGDPRTSEGIYVKTVRMPDVSAGDRVLVTGRVEEYFPGGPSSGNLSITRIQRPTVEVLGPGGNLRPPQIIGAGGRIPPDRIISDDSNGPAEESPYDPENDGIDFYESLEGMRVAIQDALSVGTIHTTYGEIWVVADGGNESGVLTPRGGIVVQEGDFNPERILIDYKEDDAPFRSDDAPLAVVGDRFTGPIVGVVSYSYYNYKVLPLGPLPPLAERNLPRETARTTGGKDVLSVAAFNVFNLAPGDPDAKFDDFATTIVEAMGSPDVVALAEVQDNDGTGRSPDTDADETARRLVSAIRALAPETPYLYVDIAPEYNQDGGAPHGNIRVGFLYRPDRVTLAERAVPGMAANPSRVNPESRAFANSRKPLAALFSFGGEEVAIVAVHFNSKGGDGALFGRVQPPTLNSENQRADQAREVAAFVQAAREVRPDLPIIVAGDFNDFSFSPPLRILGQAGLVDLVAANLPTAEQYSYIYEGNSQLLDHILVTPDIADGAEVEILHRYAEYLYEERWGDHDPVLARIRF